MEAFLSYWPSWSVLSSYRKDGLNLYVLPLAIANEVQFALAPSHLGLLYVWLDECLENVVRLVGVTTW